MGGGAFRQAVAPGFPTLHTPRMTPAEYTRLKHIYRAKIQAYFSACDVKVAVVIEAPEKRDYGDVDLFVGLDEQVDFVDLARNVGATGVISHRTGSAHKCTLGVLKDGSPSAGSVVEYSALTHTAPGLVELTTEEYAQVDVDVIPTGLFDWYTFYSSCGDLNGLLGHIVTNLGFTVSDRGLWLRMKELDASKKIERCAVADHEGVIHLSHDPEQVMRFLGLSAEKWHGGFTTLSELYEWLGGCRLLHPETWRMRREKAHERKRENDRPVYAGFFFEWLPANMPKMDEVVDQEGRMQITRCLRQQHLEEALDFFDKNAEYDLRHALVVSKVNSAVAANLLRPIVVQYSSASGSSAKRLGGIMTGFHRWVTFDQDNRPCIAKKPHADAIGELHRFLDADGKALKDAKAADEFVRLNWEEIRRLVKARVSPGEAWTD